MSSTVEHHYLLGTTLITLFAIAATYAIAVRAHFLHRVRDIPGPRYSFWLGSIAHMAGGEGKPSFYTQRHRFLRELHKAYGPVAKLVLPFGRGVLLCFADAASAERDLFKDTVAFNRRPNQNSAMPKGLFALPTGAMWRAHRQALVASLSSGALRAYHESIVSRAHKMAAHMDASARADAHADVEVLHPLVATTLDVIGDIGFGVDFGALAAHECPYTDAGSAILNASIAMLAVPSPLVKAIRALPGSLQPKSQSLMRDGLKLYAHTARGLYERALASKSPSAAKGGNADELTMDATATTAGAKAHGSLLAALAQARLPFDEACDEIISLMIAGHETTANTLSWALHLLAHAPAEQARLRALVDRVIGTDGAMEYEHVAQLGPVRDAFYEALRLFPTVPSVGRMCTRQTEVNGVRVPRGALCIHSIAAAARDPEVFGTDADEFRPARHAEASGVLWHPFGGGPRKCLGYRLAELEAVTILAIVLRRFELSPPGNPESAAPEEYTDVTLGPKRSGLRVHLRARAYGDAFGGGKGSPARTDGATSSWAAAA